MKTGLILSGGGARGFAHLGVLQALDEFGIGIDAIAGTSAGSIAGAFYLAGHKPKDILKYIRSYRIYSWARFHWGTPGILHMDKIGKLFENYLPDSFEKLSKPLTVCATDILKGTSVKFSSGKLIPAICASAAIPMMFEPVIIDGAQYVDGGILDNFPVEVLREKCEPIIGVHVNPVDPTIASIKWKDLADRSTSLMLRFEVESKKHDCDIFIEPEACGKYSMLDLAKAEEIFDAGYKAAFAMKEELLKLK